MTRRSLLWPSAPPVLWDFVSPPVDYVFMAFLYVDGFVDFMMLATLLRNGNLSMFNEVPTKMRN